MLRHWNAIPISRLVVSTALCASVLIATPTPAHAWFGWLDKFSGPGPFIGLLGEARLVCFGAMTVFENDAFEDAIRKTLPLAGDRNLSDDASRARHGEAVAAWMKARTELQAPTASARQAPPGAQGSTRPGWPEEFEDPVLRLERASGRIERFWAARDLIALVEQKRDAIQSVGALGTHWSACDEYTDRRWSLEFAVDVWRTKGSARFAEGKPVWLSTFMPAGTFRPFAGEKGDVVDIGVGAGLYWFSSAGFDDLHGLVVHLPRVGVHPPASWNNLPASDFRRWLAPLTLRGALAYFPAGFSANDFNPAPGIQDGGEKWIKSVGLFYNISALLP